MRLYLDICCFNRPFDNQDQLRVRLESEAKLEVQARIQRGEVDLTWSYVMDFENAANPFAERRRSIARWRKSAVEDRAASAELVEMANGLESAGFKAIDSLHLACAIQSGCAYFLTTDDGILSKRAAVSGLCILNPTEYILLP